MNGSKWNYKHFRFNLHKQQKPRINILFNRLNMVFSNIGAIAAYKRFVIAPIDYYISEHDE